MKIKNSFYLSLSVSILLLTIFGFEIYTLSIQAEAESPLPKFFGNFADTRSKLQNEPLKNAFSFAIVGDTKSTGTFERIAEELRHTKLDFAVLLGDCSYNSTEEEHRYLRAEISDEFDLSYPVFYVAGNHDISLDRFTLDKFEQAYGPTIFSFEYQNSLFIFLRFLPPPFSNDESLEFLRTFYREDITKYRYRFVFMHIPPIESSKFKHRAIKESSDFIRVFDDLKIDYVFSGDFHGYARVKRSKTNYIITGGGGAHLANEKSLQFHHAIVMHISSDSVEEQIIPVMASHDFEDVLERFSIAKAYPWMTKNLTLTIILNVTALTILFGLVWSLFLSKLQNKRKK